MVHTSLEQRKHLPTLKEYLSGLHQEYDTLMETLFLFGIPNVYPETRLETVNVAKLYIFLEELSSDVEAHLDFQTLIEIIEREISIIANTYQSLQDTFLRRVGSSRDMYTRAHSETSTDNTSKVIQFAFQARSLIELMRVQINRRNAQ